MEDFQLHHSSLSSVHVPLQRRSQNIKPQLQQGPEESRSAEIAACLKRYFLFVRLLMCLMFSSERVRPFLFSSSLPSENELPSYDSVEEKASHFIS